MATVTLSKKALAKGHGKAIRTNDWDDLVTVLNALVTIVTELKADHATFKTVVDELVTDLSAHVHGGITAGAANTSAGATIAAAAPATLSAATPDTLALSN